MNVSLTKELLIVIVIKIALIILIKYLYFSGPKHQSSEEFVEERILKVSNK